MFAQLVKPQTKDNDPRTLQAQGPMRGIEMPPNTPDASYPLPFYLAPPVGPYQELGNTIKTLSDDLFRLAGQEGVVGVAKSGAKSGVSQSYDFRAMEEVLKETAKASSNLECAISKLFQLYTGEKFDYDVFYEDNYHPGDVNEDVKLYTDYIGLNPGPRGRALALEQATRSVFDDLDDEQVQPVIDDIRDNAVTEANTAAAMAGMGAMGAVAAVEGDQEQTDERDAPVIPKKKIVKEKPKKGFSVKKKQVKNETDK
jgi:hypothetical protein